ncbi:MAG TPA: MBOAT family protein [Alphaproteobacteria bacterium]|nr:MBOAT family protein [Alphaproteobacteria bacterium]MDP7428286.1 MBOAT family protein [Alphaproteobacteria bacterium]HJM51746.1 MBOAT family protein [Alphaproteobacteria bacterium]
MLFNTDVFIFLFLPGTLVGFFLLGRLGNERASLLWLVAASLFYYGWWNPIYLLLVGGSMAVNYTLGQYISGAREAEAAKRARHILIGGIVFNLGLLAYFKYANFFLDSIGHLTGSTLSVGEVLLPIGISFFTFQQIAYLVDTAKGDVGRYDFVEYSLFVLFFPQLIAGPIVHHKEMLPQFATAHTYRPDLRNLSVGGSIFAIGLFKKVVLADNLAMVATPVFASAEGGATLDFFAAWQGTFCYGLQLYFDFSGYSDMAIGAARMFGIRLPINFNSPYQATGIIDFWRRWHLTLSRFLRDYLYIALGGSRRGKTRRYVNLMATMVLGGLWHGAGWNFLLWGFLHGLFLVLNHLWRALWGRPSENPLLRTLARLFTLLVVTLAWVPFRAQTMDGALAVYRGMINLPAEWATVGPLALLQSLGFSFAGPAVSQANLESLVWLVGWLIVLWQAPNTQQLMARYEPAYEFDEEKMAEDPVPPLLRGRWPLFWRPGLGWALAIGVMFALALLNLNRVSEFLYYQF